MGWPVTLPSRLSSRKTHCAHLRWPATNLSADSAAVSCCAVAVLVKGRAVLMPSTPSAYPHVISRHLASFRVVKFYVSAARPFLGWVRFPAAPQFHEAGCCRFVPAVGHSTLEFWGCGLCQHAAVKRWFRAR